MLTLEKDAIFSDLLFLFFRILFILGNTVWPLSIFHCNTETKSFNHLRIECAGLASLSAHLEYLQN